MVTIEVEPHPVLTAGAFETQFDQTLSQLPSPAWLVDLLDAEAPTPLERSETTRTQIRDLLRHGGYKPTGRGKPKGASGGGVNGNSAAAGKPRRRSVAASGNV